MKQLGELKGMTGRKLSFQKRELRRYIAPYGEDADHQSLINLGKISQPHTHSAAVGGPQAA